MELSALSVFFVKDLVFSSTIIFLSFFTGWLLYNHVILRKISLRDSLFEKDNLAAWIEFIGAFVFPTLYLAAKAVEGAASEDVLTDWLICMVYLVAYILLFTVLRLLSGLIVKLFNMKDQEGRVNLNNEIYRQNNIAASLFSVALSVFFVSFIGFMDILPEYFVISILKMSCVLIFTLIALIIYSMVLRRKTTLAKEIFIDNNTAAGVSFLGFIFAVQVMLDNAISLQTEFQFVELLAVSAISLLIFGVLSVLLKFIFSKMIKVDIWNEVYEQDNIGAAIGQAALYIGIANVIVHFMK